MHFCRFCLDFTLLSLILKATNAHLIIYYVKLDESFILLHFSMLINALLSSLHSVLILQLIQGIIISFSMFKHMSRLFHNLPIFTLLHFLEESDFIPIRNVKM